MSLCAFTLAVSSLAAAAAPAAVTVYIDLIVEDAKGRPALSLGPEDVVVVQDGVRQTVASVVAKGPLGRYELSYVPTSGKGGAVQLQVLRPRMRARGLDGPSVKPRVVQPLSPAEKELLAILESRPDAAELAVQASVLRFESTPEGLHHALTVEVPLAQITPTADAGGYSARVQIFARVLDAQGDLLQRALVERTISAPSTSQLASQTLVWAGRAHLKPGRYTLDFVARDPATSKSAVRTIPFVSPELAPGMRVSSVALLRPVGTLLVRDQGSEADDPFVLKGEPVTPTLSLKTAAAPGVTVRFFTIVYPEPSNPAPVSLRLDLLRDGNIVGSAPIALPPADERGEIRYAGGMPTRTLLPAEYKLRLHAAQGDTVSVEEVPFSVGAGDAPAQIRYDSSGRVGAIGVAPPLADGPDAAPRPDITPAPSRAIDSRDLAEGRQLLKRQQYDLAVQKLKKADKAEGAARADIGLLLSVAYYRMRAYKDGEEVVRRVIEQCKDDASMLAEAYTVLGRILADSEKKLVEKDSPRLAGAEQAFRKAAEVSGGRSETGQLALAETLYRLERSDDARALLETLAARPDVSDTTAERARQLAANPRCATEVCMPALAFVTADGRHTTPADLKGKVVLLSFWATWCPPCVAAMPDLKRVHTEYADDPFVMVGVNLDHDRAAMDEFVEKNRVAWPQISEGASDRLSDAMGVRGIPAEFLFDHEGVLIGTTRGWRSTTGRALAAEISRAVGKAKKARPASASAR